MAVSSFDRTRKTFELHWVGKPRRGLLGLGTIAVACVLLAGCRPTTQALNGDGTDASASTTSDPELSNEQIDSIPGLLVQAAQELDDDKLDAAIKTCARVLAFEGIEPHDGTVPDTQFSQAHFLHGLALLGKNDLEAASTALDLAIAKGDDALKSQAYLKRAVAKFDVGAWRDVLEDCTHAIQFRQNRAEAIFLRGKAFIKIDAPDIAIIDFGDALVSSDKEFRSEVFLARAKAYARLNNWNDVLDDCTRAIRERPDNGEAFLMRGLAFQESKQIERAEIAFNEARRLGVASDELPMEQPALVAKPAIESGDPASPAPLPEQSLLDTAESLIDRGQVVVAREMLESTSAFDANGLRANQLRARANYLLGDFPRAIRDSTRALRIDPKCAGAFRTRGLSHLGLDKNDEAILDLNSAIGLDSSMEKELRPMLVEAKAKGGLDPRLRSRSLEKIRQWASTQSIEASTPTAEERWLVNLMKMQNSSQQIDQLNEKLASKQADDFESIRWLADYLMVRGGGSDIDAIREWLSGWDQPTDDEASLQHWLRDAVASRSTAASNGINVYADLATYALAYRFHTLLRECYGSGACRGQLAHHVQCIDSGDLTGLRIVLPTVTLDNREVKLLLERCMERNRVDHARFVLARYESGLSAEVLDFLQMDSNVEPREPVDLATR